MIQVCLLAAIGTLNTAIINPAYGPLAKEFDITTVSASYQTTVVIALNGVGPFLWIPLANVYGRRPVYLFTTLLGFGSALGSAYSKNYKQLIVARVFNGLWPAAMALGPATVVDLFFYHQRGRAMGIFTVILTSGAHIAPIVGGLIGQYLGWRWTFKFAAILDGVMLLVITFCLPETLYIRDQSRLTRTMSEREIDFTPKTYVSQLRLYSTFPQLKLRWNQFIIPSLKMAKYPSVLFPALYYATSYGFASILPAVTVASIFSEVFHWDTLEIGLAYGGALSIGGESPLLCRFLTILTYFGYTGRICSRHSARRHHQARSPSVCRSKPTARIPSESNLDWSYPRPCWIINIRLYTGIPRLLVCPSFWYGARLLWLASRRHHLLHL